MDILKTLSSALSSSTTYAVGRRQAKAYTILFKHTASVLTKFGITPKEWALLGLVFEKPKLRPIDVAHELGIEAAYVTAMTDHLKKMGLLTLERHGEDTRAKIICLTQKGRQFVKNTEPKVRTHMKLFIEGIEMRDVLGYLAVIEHIIKTDTNKRKK